MRDNSNQLPEIVTTYNFEDKYYAIIGIEIESIKKYFRIGIMKNSYNSILKIIQSKPFSTYPGINYKYYFVPSIMKKNDNEVTVRIFIENGNQAKQFDCLLPTDLAQNMLWFFNIKSFDHIKEIPEVNRDGSVI